LRDRQDEEKPYAPRDLNFRVSGETGHVLGRKTALFGKNKAIFGEIRRPFEGAFLTMREYLCVFAHIQGLA
jgi:hypothetical protein